MLLMSAGLVVQWSPTATAQRKGTDWRAKRKALDRDFADELQEIALWCRSSGIPQQVPQTYAVYHNRDLRRQYIYLPSTKKMPPSRTGKSGQWLEKIGAAKVEHAARVYDLAKKAAGEGDNSVAFQLLHEVVHFDRDHEEARSVLGHKDKGDSWQINTDRLKVRKNRPNHKVVNWKQGDYITVITPHFTIDSSASEEETKILAEDLEKWHDVWRQVFFEFWTSASVKRWIEKKVSFKEPKKRYDVVFFKNHDEYISSLEKKVKGIGVSTGYYSQDLQVSFFSAGDDPQNIDTWKHELSHQLFRETVRARPMPFKEHFLWLDEGIAMYFESITDSNDYVTLGGFDARRLQYARIRKLREGFFVPTAKLSSMSQGDFQSNGDISSLYSESAGIAHMLMNSDRGRMQPKINEFMKAIHKRRVEPDAFEKILGKPYQQLDLEYLKYLETNSDEVIDHLQRPDLRTELALPNANLSEVAFESIGTCKNLRWLDVTGSKITPGCVQALRGCEKLKQIFFTRCQVDPAAFSSLNQLRGLEELDLSASSVTTRDLLALTKSTKLKVLRLTATPLGDDAPPIIAQMQTLKTLDISKTKISDLAVKRLQLTIPNAKIIRQ